MKRTTLILLICIITGTISAQVKDPTRNQNNTAITKPKPKKQTSTKTAFAQLIVTTDLDVKINVNGENTYTLRVSDGIKKIPVDQGANFLKIDPLDGGEDGYIEKRDIESKGNHSLELSLNAKRAIQLNKEKIQLQNAKAEEKVWAAAVSFNFLESGYEEYLNQYPNGKYVGQARDSLKKIQLKKEQVLIKLSPPQESWNPLFEVTFTKKFNEELGFKVDTPIYSNNLKAIEGKEISFTGYYNSPEGYSTNKEFILSAYPLPFSEGEADLRTIIWVQPVEPIEVSYSGIPITIRGKLKLNRSDTYTGIDELIFLLDEAKIIKK